MKFRDWWSTLTKVDQTYVKSMLGIDAAQVSRYRSGAYRPSDERKLEICYWSGGLVCPGDWFDLEFELEKIHGRLKPTG